MHGASSAAIDGVPATILSRSAGNPCFRCMGTRSGVKNRSARDGLDVGLLAGAADSAINLDQFGDHVKRFQAIRVDAFIAHSEPTFVDGKRYRAPPYGGNAGRQRQATGVQGGQAIDSNAIRIGDDEIRLIAKDLQRAGQRTGTGARHLCQNRLGGMTAEIRIGQDSARNMGLPVVQAIVEYNAGPHYVQLLQLGM